MKERIKLGETAIKLLKLVPVNGTSEGQPVYKTIYGLKTAVEFGYCIERVLRIEPVEFEDVELD